MSSEPNELESPKPKDIYNKVLSRMPAEDSSYGQEMNQKIAEWKAALKFVLALYEGKKISEAQFVRYLNAVDGISTVKRGNSPLPSAKEYAAAVEDIRNTLIKQGDMKTAKAFSLVAATVVTAVSLAMFISTLMVLSGAGIPGMDFARPMLEAMLQAASKDLLALTGTIAATAAPTAIAGSYAAVGLFGASAAKADAVAKATEFKQHAENIQSEDEVEKLREEEEEVDAQVEVHR